MENLSYIFDLLLNLDKYLPILVSDIGVSVYILLFAVIFIETGIVIFPFLPGDSLLFATGMIAATGTLNIWILLFGVSMSAIFGNIINYTIGKYFNTKLEGYNKDKLTFIGEENIRKTERFFERYGNKTIIISRFIPIIRTIAPFLAGFGKMNYSNFIYYNFIGGITWSFVFLYGGYYFGNTEFVKNNFSLVILSIIIISLMPAIIQIFKKEK